MKRIRIKEFFRDYDKLRKGTVSVEQFKRVLNISNISISEQEMDIILKNYKLDDLPNGLVRYLDFCDAID